VTHELADLVRVEDPGFYDDGQFTVYGRLQREAPVFHYEPLDVYLLTRMDDIRHVSTHPELFSNTGSLTLNQLRMAGTGSPHAFERFNDPEGELVITKDPPRHRALRGVMTPVLAPRYLSTFQPVLDRLCRTLIDDVVEGEVFDFVEVVSSRLPLLIAAELLGVTEVDLPRMQSWVSALEELTKVEDAADLEEPGERFDEMKQFLRDQLAAKRQAPGSDMMSVFLKARLDDAAVPDAVVLAHISTLMSNGGTTRLMLTSLAARFAENPGLAQKCRTDPDLLHASIEECLRMDPPTRGFVRTVVHDTQVGDAPLEAGQRLYMLYPAANRDPAYFDHPHDFDAGRTWTSSHAAFGFGPHFCLGAGLARMEAFALFTELLSRYGEIRLEGPATRYPHVQLNGFATLPVSIHR
jgi:cytochrome P450